MISISINTSAVTAALTVRNPIKAGGAVPVSVVFSSNPGTLTHLELSLSEDSSSGTTLAYLDTWTTENETTRRGWLDANDPRLVEALTGVLSKTMLCEMSWTAGGKRQIAPNFSLTVQRPVVTGPESSEGGPFYYNQAQIDAFFAALDAESVGLEHVTNDAQVKRAEMGEPGGVATLEEETGKIPPSQLPDVIFGQVQYMGGWDADSNTPDLSSLPAEKGYYYVVLVAGTSDPDDMGRDFGVADWIVYNGESWDKIDNTEPLATTLLAGLVRFATGAEANQRRSTSVALTPATLRAINVDTLLANKTLIAGDAPVQMLNPSGASRDVTLAVIAATPTGDQVGYGHTYRFYHTGTAYSLVVKNSAGTLLARADAGDMIDVTATAAGWRVVHAPRSGAITISYPIDIVAGSAGDDITIYTPPDGYRADIIAARWITDTTSGTISTQGQVTLQAGTTAISAALSLSTSPTADNIRDFTLSSPRSAITPAAPLTLDKTQLASGTTPAHTGFVIAVVALL